MMTRDYQVDPFTGRRVELRIEALEPPDPIIHSDAETAVGLRSALTWLRTMFAIIPLTVGVRSADEHTSGHEVAGAANTFADPYRVPDANFGWSAVDACYSFGSFDLAPDEALVVTHRPPTCRFWNLVVWNPYMGTHNAGDGPTSVNHGTAVPNADGTVTVVIAQDARRAPERRHHPRRPSRQPGVPLVPRRRGARAAGGVAGQAGRRTSRDQLSRA